ncbi:MAG TPA: hypothetical protein VIK11_08920 [Tepidiformaceae bacterium]
MIAQPLFCFEGSEVGAAMEDDCFYLLIDHRLETTRSDVARVELWESIAPVDAGDPVLLLICDATLSVGNVTTASQFSAVVADLRARVALR